MGLPARRRRRSRGRAHPRRAADRCLRGDGPAEARARGAAATRHRRGAHATRPAGPGGAGPGIAHRSFTSEPAIPRGRHEPPGGAGGLGSHKRSGAARQPSPRRRGPGYLCALSLALSPREAERRTRCHSRSRPAPPPPPGSRRGYPRLRPPGRHALEPSRRAHRGRRGTVALVRGMVDRASVAAGRVGRGAGRRHALPPGPRRLRLASRRHLRLMGASPSRPAVTVLVTDMDNTLFDWLGMWRAAFGAMLARLTADSGVPRETLEQEFFALHQRHGTTEYAFAIQELPSLRARHPPE